MSKARLLLLAGVLALVAIAVVAALQPGTARTPRVGILIPGATGAPGNLDGFYQALRDLGYVEGQNLLIERRYADGRNDRLEALAAEFVQSKVDVIVALGPQATLAAHAATTTIPVVISTLDAVDQGLIASYGRPGGNLTGWSVLSSESGGKQLALLKEAIPGISRVAVLANPAMPGHANLLLSLNKDAERLGLSLYPTGVTGPEGLEVSFTAMKRERVDAFIVIAEPVVIDSLRHRIVALAAAHRLPAMYPWRIYTQMGGLMSYGPSLPDLIRRHAYFVNKLLTGTKPADLPVEIPDRYELVLNLKTAQALGITFPPAVRISAQSTIE